ncbi:MAG: hypothetical protein HY540_05590 [Deltaproteobacteria bacterium]|nr:hypothetical protein [Deltaproteobacteria bacterium]
MKALCRSVLVSGFIFMLLGCHRKPLHPLSEMTVSGKRALAVIQWHDAEGIRETEAALVWASPDKFRAEAIDPLAGVWAVAASDGKKLRIWNLDEGRVRTVALNGKNLAHVIGGPIEIEELISRLNNNDRRIEIVFSPTIKTVVTYKEAQCVLHIPLSLFRLNQS